MDPRCPACDRPVGATATSCMHCDAEFTTPAGVEISPTDGVWDESRAGSQSRDASMTTSDQSSVQSQVSPSCDSRLVGLDAVIPSPILTVIGVAASPLFALWTVVIVGVLVGGTAGLAGGGLVWLIAMVYLVTRSSIFGTIRGLCYAVAVLLLLTPSIVLTDAAKGGTFGGQLILFGVSEFVFGCIALGLIGIGYRLGRYRPSVRSVDG